MGQTIVVEGARLLRRKREPFLRNPPPSAAAPRLAILPPIRRPLLSRAFLPCLALFVLCYYAALVTSGSFVLWAPAIGPGDSGQASSASFSTACYCIS